MVARTKVARARLTPEEYVQYEKDAAVAGVRPGEYLRGLIVGHRGEVARLSRRIDDLTTRVELLEVR